MMRLLARVHHSARSAPRNAAAWDDPDELGTDTWDDTSTDAGPACGA